MSTFSIATAVRFAAMGPPDSEAALSPCRTAQLCVRLRQLGILVEHVRAFCFDEIQTLRLRIERFVEFRNAKIREIELLCRLAQLSLSAE